MSNIMPDNPDTTLALIVSTMDAIVTLDDERIAGYVRGRWGIMRVALLAQVEAEKLPVAA